LGGWLPICIADELREAIVEEREACAAMVLEKFYTLGHDLEDVEQIAAAIRARR
jgi:hypothetical protein